MLEAGASWPPAPRPRWVSWLRQTSLRVRLGAAVVAAAVVAAAVFVAIPPGAPKSAYTSVAVPCGVVRQDTLARYLPNPASILQLLPTNDAYQALNGAHSASTCKWSSTSGGEDRTLVVTAVVYGPSSGVTEAQRAYHSVAASLGCRCLAVSVSTQPVTGLGDQAEGFLITPGPDATVVTAPNASSPGTDLIVQSSNAGIYLEYTITDPATGATLPPAGSAAQLAWMASVARDVLAAFARPRAVSAGLAPLSNEPQYKGSRDPCLLIKAATLASYAPGAAVSPQPSASGASSGVQQQQCTWYSNKLLVLLTLIRFPNPNDAFLGYMADAGIFSQSSTQVTVTGSVWMPDLGEDGLGIFEIQPGTGRGVQVYVWSGNSEISLWLNYSGAVTPDRTAMLMAGIAMARDVLADLPARR